MIARSESGVSAFDRVKLMLAAALVFGGIFAFYYFSDQLLLYRALGLVGVVLVAGAAAFTTRPGGQLWTFMRESRTEVRKVVWPSRQETTQTTLIVIVMVFVVGMILWLLDMFLFWGVRLLTGQGS
jgi:preprotein translocase subunit SecE